MGQLKKNNYENGLRKAPLAMHNNHSCAARFFPQVYDMPNEQTPHAYLLLN